MFGLTPQQLEELFSDDDKQSKAKWSDKELLQYCPSAPDLPKHNWVEVSFYSGCIACKWCDMEKKLYDKMLTDIEKRDKMYETF